MLQFWTAVVSAGSPWAKIEVLAGLRPSWRLQGRAGFRAFSASSAARTPGLVAPACICRAGTARPRLSQAAISPVLPSLPHSSPCEDGPCDSVGSWIVQDSHSSPGAGEQSQLQLQPTPPSAGSPNVLTVAGVGVWTSLGGEGIVLPAIEGDCFFLAAFNIFWSPCNFCESAHLLHSVSLSTTLRRTLAESVPGILPCLTVRLFHVGHM